MTYTAFEYLYRDASNYKAFGEVWLSGTISDDERCELMRCFDSGEFFVAEQVGLPALYDDLFQSSAGRTDDDHAWHTFEALRAEQALPDGADIWGTPPSLIAAFAAAKRN